jgi:hypothetical protein
MSHASGVPYQIRGALPLRLLDEKFKNTERDTNKMDPPVGS